MKTIYTSKGRIIEKGGKAFPAFCTMFQELVSSRELTWRWFLRDFSAKYRQTALGFLWAVIMPIITVGIFVEMHQSGVFQVGDINVPYPLYALLGLTVWGIFSTGLSSASNALANAGPMLVKINFPKISLVVASTGQGIVDFLIKACLVAGLLFWYKLTPSVVGLLLAFLAVIFLYFLTLGMGFFLSLVAGVLRDIPKIINIVLIMFMLFTPVLYVPPKESILYRMNIYNPVNYLVNGPRELLLQGKMLNLGGFLLSGFFAIVVFFIGWRLFYVAQTRVAERL